MKIRNVEFLRVKTYCSQRHNNRASGYAFSTISSSVLYLPTYLQGNTAHLCTHISVIFFFPRFSLFFFFFVCLASYKSRQMVLGFTSLYFISWTESSFVTFYLLQLVCMHSCVTVTAYGLRKLKLRFFLDTIYGIGKQSWNTFSSL